MGDQVRGDRIVQSADHQAAKEPPAGADSPRIDDLEQRIDTGNIEEAVSTLREGGLLNYDVSAPGLRSLPDSFLPDLAGFLPGQIKPQALSRSPPLRPFLPRQFTFLSWNSMLASSNMAH